MPGGAHGERVCKERVCKQQGSECARSEGTSSKCARSARRASRQRPSAVPEGAVALPAGGNTHPQALGFTYKERHGGRGCVATRCGRQPGGRQRLSPGPGPSRSLRVRPRPTPPLPVPSAPAPAPASPQRRGHRAPAGDAACDVSTALRVTSARRSRRA